MKKITFGGLVSALFFVGCQVQDRISAPDTGKAEKNISTKSAIAEYGEFDPEKINTSTAPPVFRDDTISNPQPAEGTEWDGIPLKKAAASAAVTWTQLPGRCNDVAIGRFFYCIDKVTLKLKKWSNNAWVNVPGPIQDGVELTLKRVDAAIPFFSLFGELNLAVIASNGATYYLGKPDEGWHYLTGGGNGVDIAVDLDLNIRYLGTNNTLYLWRNGAWVAVAGQAGQRLSVARKRTYLVSNGYYLYELRPVADDPAVVKGYYTGAFTVNDVCGGSPAWWDTNNPAILMHSGSGYIYYEVQAPVWTWKRLYGDSNTRNLACAPSDLGDHWTVVLQTNNDGYTFYTQFRDI